MAAYEALVAARKACRLCIARSPGRIRSCAEFDFDPEVVSLWEQWLGHRHPELLVVGQDFGNVDYFERNRGNDALDNKTNANLWRLLGEAGIAAKKPPDRDPGTRVFLTNSILCLKEGAMTRAIWSSWVETCTKQHLVPLLRYLRPPIVVGMGNHGWQAVRQAFVLGDAPQRISVAAGRSWAIAGGPEVFAVGHCGPLGLINRDWPRQLGDWRRIGEAVAAARARMTVVHDYNE